uniref:Uncharacterized protein n=1 Tax=Cacopsylla melanoneura TaxID=428564 RepID=A0A8D8W1X2_9HEMI
MYQIQCTHIHRVCLSLFEIIFQRIAKPFRELDEFSFPLFQRLFVARSRDETGHFVHSVQQFLNSRRNLFDCLEESFPVCNFIWNTAEDFFQRARFLVQLLESIFRPVQFVFDSIHIRSRSLEPQNTLVHINAKFSLPHNAHNKIICKAWVCCFCSRQCSTQSL